MLRRKKRRIQQQKEKEKLKSNGSIATTVDNAHAVEEPVELKKEPEIPTDTNDFNFEPDKTVIEANHNETIEISDLTEDELEEIFFENEEFDPFNFEETDKQ